ncbi:MAG: antibiotic biosynthesis monooxygenase [Chthoniobacteraceae bacterium]
MNLPTPTSAEPVAAGCPFHHATAMADAARPPKLTLANPQITFVALSKFVIANDMVAEVKEAFRHRPHLVDDQPGFVRMEVLSPAERPNEIWLITYWTEAESFKAWHHSHLYHQSHKGIPKGLKLVPGEQEIRHFEHICS